MPLQETLKRLPTPDQPIPEHGELYISLCSIPTAKNVVWLDLVDRNNVYKALLKLQEINPLYHNIQLPVDASSLNLHLAMLVPLQRYVLMKISQSLTILMMMKMMMKMMIKRVTKDPMVRKVEKEEEADMYKNYTIQALTK